MAVLTAAAATVTRPGGHLDLVLSVLSGDVPAVVAALREAPDGGRDFLEYVRSNQLASYLHSSLADRPGPATLPPGILDQLAPRRASAARKRTLLEEALAEVSDACQAAGVPHIVLKGPQLGERFYGHAEHRTYWDLDLLVRRGDLSASRRLLRDLGFRQGATLLFGERISLAVVHALDYTRGEVGLDLHWKLSSHPAFHIDYQRLWARRQAWESSGRRVDVLSPDYVLTLNLLSSFKDIERGAFRLRSFVDLWMILQSVDNRLDWDGFVVERREENVSRLCTSMLDLFLVLFRAADRFPGAADAVARHPGVARVAGREAALALIAPTFLGPARRLWAARHYEIPRTRHALWWALSLPVRVNAHKPGKVSRWSRSVRTWLRRQA